MDKALFGFISLIGIIHLILVVVPFVNTLKSDIPRKSKLLRCLFLVSVPIVGAMVFHFRYRNSLFSEKAYEISGAEERAKWGTLAPDDD